MKFVTNDGYEYYIFPSRMNYKNLISNMESISNVWEDKIRYYLSVKADKGRIGSTLYVIDKKTGSVGTIGNMDFAIALQDDCKEIIPSIKNIKIGS